MKRLLHVLLLLFWFIAPPLSAQTAEGEGDQEEFDDEYWEEQTELIADPLEPFNRAMFAFNDRLYFYVLKPVARAYRVVPEPVRASTSNFFTNLRAPIRIFNSLAQFKLVDAGNELLRFGINSTIGIGGLFDPARKYLNIRQKDEDMGQTLGHYGVGQGPYLVMPFFGATSLRDGAGGVFDGYYMGPLVVLVDDNTTTVALMAFEGINTLSLDRDTYEAIKRDALDPYSFIRDAYAQQRSSEVKK